MPKKITKITPTVNSYKELSFELDELLTWFESPDFDIDLATTKHQRAMEVITELENIISSVENSIEHIKLKFGST